MSLAAKTSYNFYVETGAGGDKADPNVLAEAKQYAAADRDKGNDTLLRDENFGALIVNIQHLSDDVDELRRFVAAQDELLEILRSTTPTGLQYDSGWYIPITGTEWAPAVAPTKNKATDGYHGNSVGWNCANSGFAYCEKLIPIGFRADSAIIYGSTSQKFIGMETAINANTNNSLGSLTDHGSTLTFSSQIVGDGVKSITIHNKIGNDANDVIYGGKINLTQV